jgi:hypothetical protein
VQLPRLSGDRRGSCRRQVRQLHEGRCAGGRQTRVGACGRTRGGALFPAVRDVPVLLHGGGEGRGDREEQRHSRPAQPRAGGVAPHPPEPRRSLREVVVLQSFGHTLYSTCMSKTMSTEYVFCRFPCGPGTMAVGTAVTEYAVRPTLPQTAGVRALRSSRVAALLVSASALTVSVFLGGGRGATLPSLVVSAWAGVAQETSARILCRGYMRF